MESVIFACCTSTRESNEMVQSLCFEKSFDEKHTFYNCGICTPHKHWKKKMIKTWVETFMSDNQ